MPRGLVISLKNKHHKIGTQIAADYFVVPVLSSRFFQFATGLDWKELGSEHVMNRQQIGIYPTDSVEYRHIEKIADALTEMGVSVDVDTTMSVTSEVGLFLAHRPGNKPGLATTSVCMLHDLSNLILLAKLLAIRTMGHFDYGILPNKFWGEMYAGLHCRCG